MSIKIKRKWPLAIVCLFLFIFIMYEMGFRINTTESMPVGLYLITGTKILENDDLVCVRLSQELMKIGLERGYIKTSDTMLIKRLIALPGDTIVYKNHHITVNDLYNYNCGVSDKDGHDRFMNPVKEGIYRLGHDEYWVLGRDNDSWDSRYFGPIKGQNIYSEVKFIIGI